MEAVLGFVRSDGFDVLYRPGHDWRCDYDPHPRRERVPVAMARPTCPIRRRAAPPSRASRPVSPEACDERLPGREVGAQGVPPQHERHRRRDQTTPKRARVTKTMQPPAAQALDREHLMGSAR